MNEEIVKSAFKKQAKGFSNSNLTMNNSDYLTWMLRQLDLRPHYTVLDVAAGTGIFSRAIAPHVHSVTAIDLSDDMIQEGLRQNTQQIVTNIQYDRGNVEALPYPSRSFDLVVSRFAFHHFIRPETILREMARVSKQQVFVVDLITSEDEESAAASNKYEQLRDPSHVHALMKSEFISLFEQCGLKKIETDILGVEVNVRSWLELTQTGEETATSIIRSLQQELHENGKKTGLRPFLKNSELYFRQRWLAITGTV